MKITAITIFPEYFAPLNISLIGKARENGLIECDVLDLRNFTHDPHRSVDDTPYGGGAGMVMKPEPWGEALDSVLTSESDLVVLTPAGQRFHQRYAEKLSQSRHIVFACGRYEGIDSRVSEHYRTSHRVHEISLGDYVLNGGEVAALAIIESVVRLIPGVVGNPQSLIEESHASEGVLEYPIYTKPASWRGISVPEVLLSGNHGEIAQWRRAAAEKRSQHADRQ